MKKTDMMLEKLERNMSLKDALEKAGIKTTSSENYRKRAPVKEKTKVEKHQETRIFCEVCDTTQQDVERYKHRMPLVDAEWICVNCADKNSIHDDCRMTEQSHASKNKTFLRFYGPTHKDIKTRLETLRNNRGPRNGNQSGNRANDRKPNDRHKKRFDNKEKNFNK